jgi:hypothetical protein
MLQKDDAEHPVPEPLRSTFRQIADAFTAGDFQLRDHPIHGVRPIDPDTAKWIADNISAYGETLDPVGRSRLVDGRDCPRWLPTPLRNNVADIEDRDRQSLQTRSTVPQKQSAPQPCAAL